MADKLNPVLVTDEMIERAAREHCAQFGMIFDYLDVPQSEALAAMKRAIETVLPSILAKRDAEIRARIEAEYCVGGILSAEDEAFNDGLSRAISLLMSPEEGGERG